MKMEADRMANLRLNEKDVVTERDVVLEERRSRVENEPSSILNEQMMAALYQSHPYGIPIIGWKHEIEKLNRGDALEFYQRFYAPNNAILVVAGDVEVDEVKKLASETYGKVKAVDDAEARQRPKEPRHQASRRLRLEDPRAGQATVQRFYVCPSYTSAQPGEAEALDLLMKIAGSGSTSRLYKKLVVEKKMAAGAGGWYASSGLDSGRIAVYGVAGGDTDIAAVEAEIDAVIANIVANGVTQKELDRAREAMIADFVYGSDSQSRLARRYGWGMATGRSIQDIEEWPDRLKKVTVDDVKKVAAKYFDAKQSVTGVLLPTKKGPDKAGHANGKQKS
jgi:zinc protease